MSLPAPTVAQLWQALLDLDVDELPSAPGVCAQAIEPKTLRATPLP